MSAEEVGELLCNFPSDTKVLDLSHLGIRHLPCLLNFHCLEVLHIEYNELVYLPPFPYTLKRIYCSNNKLKALPPLPEELEFLDCSNNRLKSLPIIKSGVKVIRHGNI